MIACVITLGLVWRRSDVDKMSAVMDTGAMECCWSDDRCSVDVDENG